MSPMRLTRSLFLVILLVVTAVGQEAMLKLPSGKQVKVIKTGPIYNNTTFKKLGFVIQYETELPISDAARLREEAGQVFEACKQQMEKQKETDVIISATTKPTGVILKKTDSYNFVYQKKEDGKWALLSK